MLDHTGDESVCELLEVGLGMLARARLSEGLRNTAQSSVQGIVRACFLRLRGLTPGNVERLLDAGRGDQTEPKVKPKEEKEKERGKDKKNGLKEKGKENGDVEKFVKLESDTDGEGYNFFFI